MHHRIGSLKMSCVKRWVLRLKPISIVGVPVTWMSSLTSIPIVTDIYRKRRRMIVRIASAAVAAGVLLSFLSLLVPDRASFAQVAQAIERATTITWKRHFLCASLQRRWKADVAAGGPNGNGLPVSQPLSRYPI